MTRLEVGKEYWIKAKLMKDDGGLMMPYMFAITEKSSSAYWLDKSVEVVEAIPEREKVTIPKVVAEWIEEHKGQFSTVYTAFSILTKREYGIKKWVNDNQDTFARAWLDGYTVEEPLGVLLVDLPVDASYSYLRYGNVYLIEYTDTIKTINLRAIKVTEAEAKEKYPNFRWVSLEELENEG